MADRAQMEINRVYEFLIKKFGLKVWEIDPFCEVCGRANIRNGCFPFNIVRKVTSGKQRQEGGTGIAENPLQAPRPE